MLWRTTANRDNFYRLILVLISFYQLYPCFFYGLFPAWLDSKLYFMPFREIVADAVKSGEMPFWNPFIYCGAPLMANMQSAVFYPLNVVFYVFPPEQAGVIFMFLGSLLTAFSMFAYVREKGLGSEAAFMASGIFTFGYYMYVRIVEFADYHVIAWTPAALYFSLKHAKKGGLTDGILAVLSCSMSLLAGHPQVFAYCMILVFGMYFFENIKKGIIINIKYSLIALLLIILLTLPQTAITFEYILNSARMGGGVGYELSAATHMDIEHLVAFFMPFISDFFTSYTRFMNWAALIDIGAPAVVFMAAAFFISNERKNVIYLAIITVISLFFASLGKTFFYEHVFKTLPFIASVRYPAKINVITLFSAVMLAAYGFETFVNGNIRNKKKEFAFIMFFYLLFLICVLILMLLFREKIISFIIDAYSIKRNFQNIYNVLIKFQDGFIPSMLLHITVSFIFVYAVYRLENIKKSFKTALAFLAVFFVVGAVDPVKMGFVSYKNSIKKEMPVINFVKKNIGNQRILAPDLYDPISFELQADNTELAIKFTMDSLMPNSPMLHGIKNVTGFDSLIINRYKEFVKIAADKDAPWESGTFPLLSAKFVASIPKLKSDRLKHEFSAATNIYKFNKAEEVVFFMPNDKAVFMDDKKVLSEMSRGDFDHKKALIISGLGENKKKPPKENAKGFLLSYSRNGLNSVMAAIWAPAEGYAVITENNYPGWKALVNGMPAEIYRAYHTFMAVKVPAGENRIEMYYAPNNFKAYFIAALSVMFLIFIIYFLRIIKNEI